VSRAEKVETCTVLNKIVPRNELQSYALKTLRKGWENRVSCEEIANKFGYLLVLNTFQRLAKYSIQN
jgi:hypothetical protein